MRHELARVIRHGDRPGGGAGRHRAGAVAAAWQRARLQLTAMGQDPFPHAGQAVAGAVRAVLAGARAVVGDRNLELRREGLPSATFGNLRTQELTLAKTRAP